ncbi:MAG: hypothetical protein WD355_07895 [Balneolaceae bacterium]
MKTILNRIGLELFEPKRPVTNGEFLFHKLFELFIMFHVVSLSWKWASYTLRNSEVVLQLGLANYLDVSYLFGNSLPLILAGLITLLTILSYFRIGFRWQYLFLLLLFHLQHVTRFSQGEIPHSANLIGMTLLCYGLGVLFFEQADKRWRFIFGSMIFFIGLGYTSAAIAKMIGTGWNWADGHHLWLWIGEKGTDILSREGAFTPGWLQSLALQNVAIATIILAVGWITELAGVAIWFRKLRPWVITAIIGMHLGITMTMNIRFDLFVYQLILIGYPWYRLIDRSKLSKFHPLIRYAKRIA